MALRNTLEKYGYVAIAFHWTIAFLILGLLAVGLYMVDLPISLKKVELYGVHKSVGLTVLFLACLRLIWRLTSIIPVLPQHMPWWQQHSAHFTHYLLYATMFAMPISGWLMSSALGFPVSFFGLFTLPDMVKPDPELGSYLKLTHEWVGYLLMAQISLHVGATLFHVFYYRDNILRRMLP